MKKNVLAFVWYLPAKKYGGPLKSIYNLVETTYEQMNYYIISPDHDFGETKKLTGIHKGWNEVGHAKVCYMNEKEYKYNNILARMEESQASLLYLCGYFLYKFNFPAIRAAKAAGIPVLLAPRSDLLPNCIHMKFPKKYAFVKTIKLLGLYKDCYYQSTSADETYSIIHWTKADKGRIVELPNIAGCPENIKRNEKKRGELKMVFISRIHPRKNLKYAIDVLKKVKGKVLLDIYGSMEDRDYWNECQKSIDKLDGNKEVSYKGILEPLEVQKTYYGYDAFILPTLNENYGHVIVEAMVAGCVCIISKGTTPWDDYNGRGGFCCSLDEPEDFSRKIEYLVGLDESEIREMRNKNRRYVKEHFNNNELGEKYIRMFDLLINEFRQEHRRN